jgi:hypothetical protein
MMELSSESNPLGAVAAIRAADKAADKTSEGPKLHKVLSNVQEENLWESYDEFCQVVAPVSWSTLDQKRLISMDYLASRVFQIHSMDHTYRHTDQHNLTKYLGELQSSNHVVDLLLFSGNRSLETDLSF